MEKRDLWEEGFPPEIYDYASVRGLKDEEGTVVGVRGDTAQVLMRRTRYCEGCGSCCVAVGDDAMLAEVDNPIGAEEGDRVVVDIPAAKSIRAAYVLYGIPLLAFLCGFGLGSLLGFALSDGGLAVPLGLIFAFALLALSFIVLSRIYGPHSRAAEKYRLSITRKVYEASERK